MQRVDTAASRGVRLARWIGATLVGAVAIILIAGVLPDDLSGDDLDQWVETAPPTTGPAFELATDTVPRSTSTSVPPSTAPSSTAAVVVATPEPTSATTPTSAHGASSTAGGSGQVRRSNDTSSTSSATSAVPSSTAQSSTDGSSTTGSNTGSSASQPTASQPTTTQPTPTRPTSTRRSSTQPSSTQPTSTRPSSTRPSSTRPTSTPSTAAPAPSGNDRAPAGGGHHGSGNNTGLAALRNDNPLFSRYSSVPSGQLRLGDLTEPVSPPDNGSVGDGQFRMACQYSHFAYDDPIVYPGQPGKSHLHMFFGNTLTNAHTTASRLFDSGGGSCNGFELNRSAYWSPALLDGRGNAVVPEQIILYYKTKFPEKVQPFPVGLKIIAGSTGSSFQASEFLFWSCGGSGHASNKSNRIPDCGGDTINASIVFPECWDGRNLDSADHRSHLRFVSGQQECPSSHPVRLPQISILLYYPGQGSVDGWGLASDGHHGSGHADGPPGGSLHADWFGGWNDDALMLWMNGCMTRARNCSYGQTGTDRRFAPLNGRQDYPGPHVLPLP